VAETNGTTADESLDGSVIVLASTQVNGGAVTSGGLSNGVVAAPFTTSSYSRNGASRNTSNDGITDWGNPSYSFGGADTTYMIAWSATPVPANGTIGSAVDANTWEFKIATFQLNMGTLGAGSTKFNMMNGTPIGAYGTYAQGRMDGAFVALFTNNTGDAFTSNGGVTLVVPEVAGLGVFASASIGLLARARRT